MDKEILRQQFDRNHKFQIWVARNRTKLFWLILIVGSVLFSIFCLVLWYLGIFEVKLAAYAGVWVFSLFSAASLFIPLPGPAVVCGVASPDLGLSPVVIGVVSGSAETLGELTGYFTGFGGKKILRRNRFYPKFSRLLLHFGGFSIFLSAVIPNPLFDVMGVAAGSAGYPLRRFVVYVFFAKSIKSIGIAYGCLWGISQIKDIFG